MYSNVLKHKGKFVAVAVIFIVLILLPIVARYAIVYVLEEQGFEQVSIEDVDINLFSGTVSIDKVHLKKLSEDKLSIGSLNIDYRWQGLFSGGIATELIELKNTRLKIIANESGDFEIVIPIKPASTELSDETPEAETKRVALPKFDVDLLRFSNIIVDIDIPKYKSQLVIDNFVLTRASTWHDYPAELVVKAMLDEALININISAEPNAVRPVLTGDVSIDKLLISHFKDFLPADFHLNSGDARAHFTFSGARDEHATIQFTLKGDVELAEVDLAYKNIQATLANTQLNIGTEVMYANDKLNFESEIIPVLSNFLLNDIEQGYKVVSFDNINIDKLTVNQDINLGIKQVDLAQFKVMPLEDKQQLLHFKNLILNNLNFSLTENALTIDSVGLAGLNYKMHLDQDYKLLDIEKLTQTIANLSGSDVTDDVAGVEGIENAAVVRQEARETTELDPVEPLSVTDDSNQTDVAGKQSLKLAIGSFEVSDESRVHMVKEFPDQTIERDFFIDTLTVNQINLNPNEPKSEFNLVTRVDEFAKVHINGDALFFEQPLTLNAQGELDGMSLPRLSPFAESVIGYQLINGQLDHKFTLTLKDNQLNMENDLLIRKIQLKENEKGENKTEAGSLPLPMAIGMLEDSEGNIDLKLPIKSDLNKTDVGLASIINTSLSKVIQKGSMSFLKYSLQPFGAILFAGEILLEQSNNIRFEPMLFNPNTADLAEGQLAYAGKLADLLANKEQIGLNLCGVSNEQDKVQLEAYLRTINSTNSEPVETAPVEASTQSNDKRVVETVSKGLIELAASRSRQLKGLFVDKGIDANRLFICKPEFNADGIAGVNIIM